MTRMTRTQISLEEGQYRFLKREAARRESSLSSVVRELVEELMRGADADGPSIMSIQGVFSDGRVTGRDHDRILHEALAERKTGKGVFQE